MEAFDGEAGGAKVGAGARAVRPLDLATGRCAGRSTSDDDRLTGEDGRFLGLLDIRDSTSSSDLSEVRRRFAGLGFCGFGF
jgi:hypothetical protein